MQSWQVVHVITHLELGGAQLATLAQVSRSSFFSGPRTLVTGGGRLLEQARALDGVHVITIPELTRVPDPRRDSRSLAALCEALSALRGPPMVVHTHSPKAGVLGRIAARRVRADRIVHSFHGFAHGRDAVGRIFGVAERSLARFAHGYTVDSAANRRQGLREALFADRPVEVVHCGIDLAHYRFDPVAGEAVRQALGLDHRALLVLTLANFKAQKDPLTWVEVVQRVSQIEPRAVFVYAGDGPLRARVEQELESRGLNAHARLVGWREDVRALLSGADVFLLTSRWEGLPQSFAQAMAVGLPIVATDVDGAPEAVEEGVTGYLRPAGDATALSQALCHVLREPALRDLLGEEARARAERFSEARMLTTLDRFYAQLTGAQPGLSLRPPVRPAARGPTLH